MDGLKDYLESKLREHEKSMRIYEDVLERATSSLHKGFVGSTVDTAIGYHMAKASYESVKDILKYMEVEEEDNRQEKRVFIGQFDAKEIEEGLHEDAIQQAIQKYDLEYVNTETVVSNHRFVGYKIWISNKEKR